MYQNATIPRSLILLTNEEGSFFDDKATALKQQERASDIDKELSENTVKQVAHDLGDGIYHLLHQSTHELVHMIRGTTDQWVKDINTQFGKLDDVFYGRFMEGVKEGWCDSIVEVAKGASEETHDLVQDSFSVLNNIFSTEVTRMRESVVKGIEDTTTQFIEHRIKNNEGSLLNRLKRHRMWVQVLCVFLLIISFVFSWFVLFHVVFQYDIFEFVFDMLQRNRNVFIFYASTAGLAFIMYYSENNFEAYPSLIPFCVILTYVASNAATHIVEGLSLLTPYHNDIAPLIYLMVVLFMGVNLLFCYLFFSLNLLSRIDHFLTMVMLYRQHAAEQRAQHRAHYIAKTSRARALFERPPHHGPSRSFNDHDLRKFTMSKPSSSNPSPSKKPHHQQQQYHRRVPHSTATPLNHSKPTFFPPPPPPIVPTSSNSSSKTNNSTHSSLRQPSLTSLTTSSHHKSFTPTSLAHNRNLQQLFQSMNYLSSSSSDSDDAS